MDLQYKSLTLGSIKESKTLEISGFTEENVFPCPETVFTMKTRQRSGLSASVREWKEVLVGGHWDKRREEERDLSGCMGVQM